MSPEVNHHKLYLNCFKEYEIKVNGWVTNVTFSSKPWKVKTGSGTKVISLRCRQPITIPVVIGCLQRRLQTHEQTKTN